MNGKSGVLNLQGMEFARNRISKEQGWNLQVVDFARNAYAYSLNRLCHVYHSSVGGSIYPAIFVYYHASVIV